MRVALELLPDTAESASLLAEWQAVWGTAGDGIEIEDSRSLEALLDLRRRCFDLGITVNANFPDNQ